MRGSGSAVVVSLLLAVACSPSVDQPTATDDGGDPVGSCNAPMRTCGDRCVNNQNDNDHCGTCNNPCTDGAVCSGGQCVRTCASGLLACDGNCIDPATDDAHCGVCNRSCGMERTCDNGSCSCATGEMVCASECVDPLTDRAHCGGCDRPCGTDEICSDGECACATGTREANCENGTDDDCDQMLDCADPDCQGMTRYCEGICGAGVEICGADGNWGSCDGGDGSPEVCGDGIDQDCNGSDLRAPDMWEPNDDCSSCPMISGNDPNVYLNAGFDSVDDPVDCFRFSATDNFGPIREFVYLTLSEIPAGHDYDLYFYRDQAACASGSSLAQSAAAGDAAESISWGEALGDDDSGTYYIRVVRYSGRTCTQEYRLTINGLN